MVAISIWLLVHPPNALPHEQKAVDVQLCALGRNPKRYNNQYVSVTAQYDSDGTEREGLSDAACKESGIALLIPRDAEGVDELRRVLHGGYPGTMDKIITGTFIGVFHWDPQGHPPRVLNVHAMRDFTVRSKAGGWLAHPFE